MAIDRLPNLPSRADVFLDANVFIYALSGNSKECRELLRRCSTEEKSRITESVESFVLILRSLLTMVGGFHPLFFSPYPFKRRPHGFSATTLPFFQT